MKIEIDKNYLGKNAYLFKSNYEEITATTNIVIFHHNDADGYCSGFLAHKYFENLGCVNIKTFACNYTTDFNSFYINRGDIVCLLDLSFTKDTFHYLYNLYEKSRKIIWIDHHESSIDLLENSDKLKSLSNDFIIFGLGSRENKISAAMMCYQIFFKNNNPQSAPLFIQFVSDWDTWTHNIKDSIIFNSAISKQMNLKVSNNNYVDYDPNNIWEQLWDENNKYQALLKFDSLIEEARPIVEAERKEQQMYLHSNKIHANLFGYNILACNRRANSLLFGDEYKKYDIVCPFVCKEVNGKIIYVYSLFSNSINCKEIAEKFGGGGHKGAAGFQLKYNIFTTNKFILKLKMLLKIGRI